MSVRCSFTLIAGIILWQWLMGPSTHTHWCIVCVFSLWCYLICSEFSSQHFYLSSPRRPCWSCAVSQFHETLDCSRQHTLTHTLWHTGTHTLSSCSQFLHRHGDQWKESQFLHFNIFFKHLSLQLSVYRTSSVSLQLFNKPLAPLEKQLHVFQPAQIIFKTSNSLKRPHRLEELVS